MGFVGTHLKKLFKEDEYVPYDLKRGEDILDEKELEKKMRGCDVVVHLAALTSISQSWENPVLYYMNNVVGTSTVCEVAKKVGVKKIVFASSSSIYAATSSHYGISKLTDEAILGTGRGDMAIVNLRFFNIYGMGQNPSYAGAIPSFFEGTNKGLITIYGDGLQTRDFIHVSDICLAIKAAAETETKDVLSIDVGTGKPVSIKELAYLIKGITGSNCAIEYKPPRSEVRHSMADIRLAKEVFKFRSKIELVDGINDLLAQTIQLSGSLPKE